MKNNCEDLIRKILKFIGENPNREGLIDTPKRVIKSFSELYKGYSQNYKDILKTSFKAEGYKEIILLKDIELFSTCEHHMLPFFGKAHVAYLPNKRIVGLSKIARLVECFSRRLQIQERLTKEIAEALNECLKPKGVAVVIEAKHFCMISRGINKQNAVMKTYAFTGIFNSRYYKNELSKILNF